MRSIVNRENGGSNPPAPVIWSFGVAGLHACLKSRRSTFDSWRLHRFFFLFVRGCVAQSAEALARGASQCRFESYRSHDFAEVAQPEEALVSDTRQCGFESHSRQYGFLAQSAEAADLKSAKFRFESGGSQRELAGEVNSG